MTWPLNTPSQHKHPETICENKQTRKSEDLVQSCLRQGTFVFYEMVPGAASGYSQIFS